MQYGNPSMINNLLIVAALVFQASANAQSIVNECDHAQKHVNQLTLFECKHVDEVIISTYQEPSITSAYSTEFDQRKLFLASSKNRTELFKKIGLTISRQTISLKSTKLANIPELERVIRRHASNKIEKFESWTIFSEYIWYAEQGNSTGFSLQCDTAIKSLGISKIWLAAAECFPYENKGRFLEALKKIATH